MPLSPQRSLPLKEGDINTHLSLPFENCTEHGPVLGMEKMNRSGSTPGFLSVHSLGEVRAAVSLHPEGYVPRSRGFPFHPVTPALPKEKMHPISSTQTVVHLSDFARPHWFIPAYPRAHISASL